MSTELERIAVALEQIAKNVTVLTGISLRDHMLAKAENVDGTLTLQEHEDAGTWAASMSVEAEARCLRCLLPVVPDEYGVWRDLDGGDRCTQGFLHLVEPQRFRS